MNKLSTPVIVVILTFIFGTFSVAGWYYWKSQKTQIILPNATWEQIFFRGINQATNLGGLTELRKTRLGNSDVEIRVWRGFSLSQLEGVILKRIDGQWSALYLKTDAPTEFKKIEIRELNPPKSGWESFWKQITDKGILTLPDASEINCEDGGFDRINYVVEINQNKVYRTYRYSNGKCPEVKQMEEIGEIIGLEFDSGEEKCKTTEWFACMKLRKSFK